MGNARTLVLLRTVAAGIVAANLPIFATAPPSAATQGVPYSWTPDVSGGRLPYGSFVLTGTLPAGLSFNTTTGAIVGTPLTPSATPITGRVSVTDALGGTGGVDYGITVAVGSTPNIAATQTAPFGAKTLRGYGIYDLGITDADTVTITSQKNAANADVTYFDRASGNRGIKLAGTYGAAPPTLTDGPYTIVATCAVSGAVSTITVPIQAGVFDASPGATEVVGLVNANPTVLLKGDTIYMRPGAHYGTLRPRPWGTGTGGYSSNTKVAIRSRVVDAGIDARGLPRKQHGAVWYGPGDVYGTNMGGAAIPIDFLDTWFYHNQVTVSNAYPIQRLLSGAYGISYDNCYTSLGPNVSLATQQSSDALHISGSNTFCTNCRFDNYGNSLTVNGNKATGQVITGNFFVGNWIDCIHIGYGISQLTITDNFFIDLRKVGGSHADAIQHGGLCRGGSPEQIGSTANGALTTFSGTLPRWGDNGEILDLVLFLGFNQLAGQVVDLVAGTISWTAGTASNTFATNQPYSAGSGTINKATGAVSLTFNTAPPNTFAVAGSVNYCGVLEPVGGTIARNIILRGTGAAGQPDRQSIFWDDTTGLVRHKDLLIENNIGLQTYTNGIFLNRGKGGVVRRNAMLSDLQSDGDLSNNPSISPQSAGENTTYEDNISNNTISVAGFSGMTAARNTNLAKNLTAYMTMFPAFNRNATTPAAAKLAFAPALGLAVALGGAMNLDGTYQGPLFPNGTWNDGSVYVP